jgi:hypothetical protein
MHTHQTKRLYNKLNVSNELLKNLLFSIVKLLIVYSKAIKKYALSYTQKGFNGEIDLKKINFSSFFEKDSITSQAEILFFVLTSNKV